MRARVLLSFVIAASILALSEAQTRGIVTIVHFNDVYEIGPIEGGRAGGLARVAAIVAQLSRTRRPLLVTLGGDYLSPSAIGTARVNGTPLGGRQVVDVLNAVGVKWATLGNHEFDVPEDVFKARMAESAFKVVDSNVTDNEGHPFANIVTSAVVPLVAAGVRIRIGLIGLTIDSNAKPWVRYLPPIDSARTAVAQLKGKVDAIVALTHLTLATDAELAAAVPEIDLILGGHEHENWAIRRGTHFTPIFKADANARSLVIVSLAFGVKGSRPDVSARLQRVDQHIKPLPAVEVRVKKWTAEAFAAFRAEGFNPDAPVVTLPEPLDARDAIVRSRPGKLTELIANAIKREADADVGIFNGGSVRVDDVLQPGPLTEYDVIRVLPFGGNVVRATFDGSLLSQVLDQGLRNQGSGGYLHSSDGTAHSSSGWTIDGAAIDPDRQYRVGISDFLLTGAETNLSYLTRSNAHVHDLRELRDIRRAVIEEMKKLYRGGS